jgi:uncharacterized protein YrrD
MLYDTADLSALTLRATDGEIGSIDDVYFDDARWTIRYLVVHTGGWLAGRKVLISPRAVQRLDIDRGELHLGLTREQIRNSPDYDSDKPISRQYETEYFAYYGYPYYWSGPYMWGVADSPATPASAPLAEAHEELKKQAERERAKGDPHLRSAREVAGYGIEATDGSVGHVETFLFDHATWSIRAIVVDTRNWWPGKHVVIAPELIDEIDWNGRSVRVRATRERIKSSAQYEPSSKRGRDERIEQIRHALSLGE